MELILRPILGVLWAKIVKNSFRMKSRVSGTEMGNKVGVSGPQKEPEKGVLWAAYTTSQCECNATRDRLMKADSTFSDFWFGQKGQCILFYWA